MIFKQNISYNEASEYVGKAIEDQVRKDSASVLGLATGSTPLGIYQYLCKSDVDFRSVTTFNLDEYGDDNGDLEIEDTYHYYMKENLFNKVKFSKSYFPDDDGGREHYYDDKIEFRGGIDIQILGIGTNGHIAFNEPGCSRNSETRNVNLSENTRKDNSRFFPSLERTPTFAYTMGISTIMKAKKIFLLGGQNKKDIMNEAAFDPITSDIPASYLQEHKNVEFILYD